MTTSKETTRKKSAKLKEEVPEELLWNTIHVFGYGTTQLIGPNIEGSVENIELKQLLPLIEHLCKMQQKGTKIKQDDLYVLNFFNKTSVDFHPRSEGNKPQRFSWETTNSKLIEKLAVELIGKIEKQNNISDKTKKAPLLKFPLKMHNSDISKVNSKIKTLSHTGLNSGR